MAKAYREFQNMSSGLPRSDGAGQEEGFSWGYWQIRRDQMCIGTKVESPGNCKYWGNLPTEDSENFGRFLKVSLVLQNQTRETAAARGGSQSSTETFLLYFPYKTKNLYP